MTGHESLEAQATGLAAGMTRVLAKPPTMADLKKVLKDYLFQTNSISGSPASNNITAETKYLAA